jgi:hypothetical protein
MYDEGRAGLNGSKVPRPSGAIKGKAADIPVARR